MTDYSAWIGKEYDVWVKALHESIPVNFKEHPVVQRMLGAFDPAPYRDLVSVPHIVELIDNIGKDKPGPISGPGLRMLYYAQQILAKNFASIVEIGGGVGEFYAILRALGYKGDYIIMDLVDVMQFQKLYLAEVERQTGLSLPLVWHPSFDACVSFYALGEFDDTIKNYYISKILPLCKHGFIIWNPHSGASKDIPFPCKISPEHPLNHPDCKQLEW